MNNNIYLELKKLTRNELVAKSKRLVQKEREILIEILHYLMIVNDRMVYLEMGFKSLFEFCVKELGYSESAAYRRIQAMKLLKQAPEIKSNVLSGTINLTQITQVQKFARFEKKSKNITSNKTDKLNLLKKLENKSTRESECILRQLSPLAVNKDSVKILAADDRCNIKHPGTCHNSSQHGFVSLLETKLNDNNNSNSNSNENNLMVTKAEIKFVADAELLLKLEELKNLISHKNIDPSFNELFHEMADRALEQIKKNKKILAKTSAPLKHSVKSVALSANSKNAKQYKNQRYIRPAVKFEVWQRDMGCCSYKDSRTQKTCGSKFQLEYDHIKPIAFGGKSEADNIRLLCRSHNQYFARKYFKKSKILKSKDRA